MPLSFGGYVNRRATVITLLILLLILLLVAQAMTTPPKVVQRRSPGGKSIGSAEDSSALVDDPSGLSGAAAASSTEERKAIVEMANNSGMLNPSGFYEVFGQVQNVGSLAAYDVRIFVTFRDSDFVEVAKLEGPAYKRTLRPGERSDFKVTLPDKGASRRVGSYVTLILIRR